MTLVLILQISFCAACSSKIVFPFNLINFKTMPLFKKPILSYKKLLMNIYQQSVRMASNTDDVIFESFKNNGLITLNRPALLNTITFSMHNQLFTKLKQWEQEKACVVIKGAGDKAFCAGGDVKMIVEQFLGTQTLRDLVRVEYLTNDIISSYKIPYIALIDRTVMGAGVGLSVHGRYRIATERTIFAMPETAIGFHPDVGGSYFLPRLKGKLGYFLSLTGHRLKGVDVMLAGIATHYCESTKLKELEEAILNSSNENDIQIVLKTFCSNPKAEFTLTPYLEKIDRCFAASTVEGIVEELRKDNSGWTESTLKKLANMSPASLKITLKALNLGRTLTLRECLKMENRITMRCTQNRNFSEGVRAHLIDKTYAPSWIPKTLPEVTDQMVNSYFDKLPEDEELYSQHNTL